MRRQWQWLAVAVLCALSTLAAAGQATLQDVRTWASADKTRVVFDLAGATEPDLFMIDDPLRLVVDLPDVRARSTVRGALDGDGLVKRLRTGIRHHNDLRVVLDLAQHVKPRSFMLDPDADHGYRLVVDLRPTNTAASKSASQTGSRASAAAVGQSDAEPARTVGGLAQAAEHRAARAEPIARTPARPSRDIVIAIDPGHGGKDPGAHGPDGTREKDVVLAIARRLKAMVDGQPNMRGVLTRDGDYYVGLRRRMVEARKDKADLFISIHADAVPGGAHATGASVYALSHQGATSEHARWLAKRENASDLVGGVSLKDKNDSLASFMLDLSQSASIEASLDAGKRVLQQLDRLGPLHKSRVQQAGFMVLKSPDIPSFLVETAFISTPKEAQKLANAGYQRKLARAMLNGLKGYFASYRPSTLIASGQVHKVRRGETLSEIAQQYGVTVQRLRRVNDLGGNMIRVGAKLTIPAPSEQQVAGLR